ncbi:MAG TPA: Yip1 family protein [Anaerolineales bacterium]|nr:Yip1 family protein [Anaerolineales bacterium]
MNEQPSAPMLPPPSGVSGWITTWREALTRPNENTYARIALSPEAKLSTAFLWVFLGSLVNFLLASLVQGRLMSQMMQNSGIEGLPAGAGGGLLTAICGAPIGALISVVFFAIGVGVFQLIAKMFGGHGTYEQLAYALAAIVTPFYFVSGVITLLSAIPIPFVGACFGLLGFGIALYVLYLEITAVKGVNRFGWGAAIASVLLPVFVIACCVAVGIFSIFSMLAPEAAEIFESMMTPTVP